METGSAIAAARAFTRNLNILLKTARLYGLEHERTGVLLQAAWSELQVALKSVGEVGLLLGVSGNQVLLDGAPLEARPTDRSFAQLLSSAGLSSIHFSPRVTRDDLSRFVAAFAARRPKSGPLAAELNATLGSSSGPPAIRINEIRFVAQDPSLPEAGVAAQLAARALGPEAKELQLWLNDPKKLLQLIAAAEGTRGGFASCTPGKGSETPSGQTVTPTPTLTPTLTLQEEDLLGIIKVLVEIGQAGSSPEGPGGAGQFQQHLNRMPVSAHITITEALARLAAASPTVKTDTPLLVQLAEHIAIRFALERYERGDASVNSVVQLLDRMKREIKLLRQVLVHHEEKMGRAGLNVESHADLLDREFWAALPEFAKFKILLSPEAWAIPPVNIRHFAGELLDRGDAQSAREILLNYATRIHVTDPAARRKATLGLTDLADVYVRAEGPLLQSVIIQMGEQLREERDAELQTLLGASFVRFSHEAAAQHRYLAVRQALVSLDGVAEQRPDLALHLWPRVKVGNRLNEFIEEVANAPQLPADLIEVLRRMPDAAVEQAAIRLGRCSLREECDRLVAVVAELGEEGITQLRKRLMVRPPEEAVLTVALLARLEPRALEELLPERLREWNQIVQDQAVRQLALSRAPERGQLLVNLLDVLDRVVLPEVVDEIGMSGEQATGQALASIAERGPDDAEDPFLRIKAIEALGRLRHSNAARILRPLVEARRFWMWQHPRELRITAAQSLRKIDADWAKSFLPNSGLSWAELTVGPLDAEPAAPWARQRRYERIQLPRTLAGSVSSPQGDCPLVIQRLSMGGGVAACQRYLKPGLLAQVTLGSRSGQVRAEVRVREVGPQQLGFELVKIGLEDRSRLRRPLTELCVKAA